MQVPGLAVPSSGVLQYVHQLGDMQGEVGRARTPTGGLRGGVAEQIEVNFPRPYEYGGWGLIY